MGEALQAAKRRLLWQGRRGLLELDLLLIPFIESTYNTMNYNDRAILARLLELPDQDLQALLYGLQDAPDAELADVIARIRNAAAS